MTVDDVRDAQTTLSSSLLHRARQHDDTAWRQLVYLYGPLVREWCFRSGVSPTDVEDIGQEVFRAVFRKIGDFRRDRPSDTFRGWLRTITTNKVRDHARRANRIEKAAGGSDANRVMQQMPDISSSLANGDCDVPEEDDGLLRRALEMIKRDFQEPTWKAFWFTVVNGRSPGDVAQELGTSLNSVYLAKSRVLRRLRTEFAELLDFPISD